MTKKEIIKKIEEYENKISELDKDIEQLNIIQVTQKVLLNRIYGTFANKYSPFYDIDAASSITLTGQAVIKQSSKIVNNFIKEQYGVEDDILIYNDTDSCYITIQPILTKLNKNFLTPDNKISQNVYHVAKEIETHLNNEITKWAKYNLNSHDSRFVFKRESICDIGIFIQKKRYILHVLDDEGIEEDKIKYVGYDVVSTATPSKVKPLIKNIVETMVKTKNYKETNEAYKKAYEAFKNIPIEDIAFPRGINEYEKYANMSNGLTVSKGTPIHVKSAIYYNTLLDKLSINNKYEKIKSGIKIRFFYAAPNSYSINSIGFINQYPKEFKIEVDRNKMFKKIVASAIERLYNVVNWRLIDPNSEAVCDLFELLA